TASPAWFRNRRSCRSSPRPRTSPRSANASSTLRTTWAARTTSPLSSSVSKKAERRAFREKTRRSRECERLFSAGCLLGRRVPLTRTEPLDDGRHDGKDDAREDHVREVLLHGRQIAERVAGEDEAQHPNESACHVEDGEVPISHLADAGDEGGKGADDRNEASEDDRLAAVLFVEALCLYEVLLVQ